MSTVSDDRAMKVFSVNLQRLMDERKVSQAVLARSIGESEARLSNYRHGLKMPGFGVSTRIAEYFGVSLDDLRAEKKTAKKN